MFTTIHTTHTAAQIDAVASELDDKAREAAHAAMTSDDPSEFVTEYMHEFAAMLALASAEQLAPGEEWNPCDILEGDWSALVEHARLLGVDLDECPHEVHRDLLSMYRTAT